jgi:formamidopyrimidine-DNA glycosylase
LFGDADAVAAWCDARLGAEPLAMTWRQFKAAVGGRRKVFKQLFLDQRPVAGVGNIYADEILFRAGVHPQSRPADLSDADLKRVWRSMRAVLTAAIRSCGTSFDGNYVTAEGVPGDYGSRLFVYKRAGEPCRACGAVVKQIRWPAGRSTHYCPRCQPKRRKMK